jgi:hypothetical protein
VTPEHRPVKEGFAAPDRAGDVRGSGVRLAASGRPHGFGRGGVLSARSADSLLELATKLVGGWWGLSLGVILCLLDAKSLHRCEFALQPPAWSRRRRLCGRDGPGLGARREP